MNGAYDIEIWRQSKWSILVSKQPSGPQQSLLHQTGHHHRVMIQANNNDPEVLPFKTIKLLFVSHVFIPMLSTEINKFQGPLNPGPWA